MKSQMSKDITVPAQGQLLNQAERMFVPVNRSTRLSEDIKGNGNQFLKPNLPRHNQYLT
jgi:hypothetical protein